MNIIIGKDKLNELDGRYVILELDIMRVGQDQHQAYALVDSLELGELQHLDRYRTLHNKMMSNYRARNWDFVDQALSHLRGRWRGALDSFYDEMSSRVSKLRTQDLPHTWDGIVDRTPA